MFFKKSEFFIGDGNDRVWLGTFGGESGMNAEFFHNIAKAVETGIIIKVSMTSKFLDFSEIGRAHV